MNLVGKLQPVVCSLAAVPFLLAMLTRVVQRLEVPVVDREAREYK